MIPKHKFIYKNCNITKAILGMLDYSLEALHTFLKNLNNEKDPKRKRRPNVNLNPIEIIMKLEINYKF